MDTSPPPDLIAILNAYGHTWEELEKKGVIIIDTYSVRHSFHHTPEGWYYDLSLLNVVGFGFDASELPVIWSY